MEFAALVQAHDQPARKNERKGQTSATPRLNCLRWPAPDSYPARQHLPQNPPVDLLVQPVQAAEEVLPLVQDLPRVPWDRLRNAGRLVVVCRVECRKLTCPFR